MKFKGRIFILILAILAPILGLISLFLIKVDLAENLFIHHSVKTYPLSHQLIVEQSFLAERNNLHALDLRFKKVNDPDNEFQLSLREGLFFEKNPEAKIILGKFRSGGIVNDKFYRFYFPFLTDSKNKSFTFSLCGQTATESASVSPIISSIDIYLNGEAYINGEPQKGDVVFKPVYKTSLIRFISFYLNKIVFNKPKVFSKIPLLFLVFLLLNGFTVLIAFLFLKAYLVLKSKKDFLKVILSLILVVIFIFILYYSPKKSFFLNGR